MRNIPPEKTLDPKRIINSMYRIVEEEKSEEESEEFVIEFANDDEVEYDEEDLQREREREKKKETSRNTENSSKKRKTEKKRNKKEKEEEEEKELNEKKLKEIQETVLRNLEKGNFKLKEIKGDGNCLYRCVALQVYGSDNLHQRVREETMNYMQKHASHYSQFVSNLEGWENYLKRNRRLGAFGGNLEIQAISELYNRPIQIFEENQLRNIFHSYQLRSPPIILEYINGNHFNCILDLTSPKTESVEDISEIQDYRDSVYNNFDRFNSVNDVNEKSQNSIENKNPSKINSPPTNNNIKDNGEISSKSTDEKNTNLQTNSNPEKKNLEQIQLEKTILNSENEILENSIIDQIQNESELSQAENQLVKKALEESVSEIEKQEIKQISNLEDEILNQVMKESLLGNSLFGHNFDFQFNDNNNNNNNNQTFQNSLNQFFNSLKKEDKK